MASAIGVSVGPGTLVQVVHKMVKELENEQATCEDMVINSFMCSLSWLKLSVDADSLLAECVLGL